MISPNDSGQIIIDYLFPGKYKLYPVYSPGDITPVLPADGEVSTMGEFEIKDWAENVKGLDDWNHQIVQEKVGISLTFDPGFEVKNSILNKARGTTTDNISEQVIYKDEDNVEFKTTLNYPKENASGLINPVVNYNAFGKDLDNPLFSNSGKCNIETVVNQVSVPSRAGIGAIEEIAKGTVLSPGSMCDLTKEIKMENGNNYYEIKPQLTYSGFGQILNNSEKNILAREKGIFVEKAKIQGKFNKAYKTDISFVNVQKYSNPVKSVSNVVYQLQQKDLKNKWIPIDISATANSNYPQAVEGVNYCKNKAEDDSQTEFLNGDNSADSNLLSSCVWSNSSGKIDISYLLKGDYRLVQISAPKHFKQTGIIVDFTIAEPTRNNPNAGINDQGVKVVPPEVYVEITKNVTSLNREVEVVGKGEEQERTDFKPDETGNVNFSGKFIDYKGAPDDQAELNFNLNYPECKNENSDNCNIGDIGNPIMELDFLDSDVEEVAFDDPIFGEEMCILLPNSISKEGVETQNASSQSCLQMGSAPNHFYWSLQKMLRAGKEHKWSTKIKETLLNNQTYQVSATINSDEGGPSKGVIDSVRFNRGMGALYLKEMNSTPDELTLQGMSSGIGVDGATISLHSAGDGKVLDTIMTSKSKPSPLSSKLFKNVGDYKYSNVVFDDKGVARIEHLDEGDYYFTVDSVPSPYYFTKDLNKKYEFQVKFNRLEEEQELGKFENGKFKNSWYLTNSDLVQYNPNIVLTTNLQNLTRGEGLGGGANDVMAKEGDKIKYTAKVEYLDDVNRGILYNPKLNIQTSSNLDTSDSDGELGVEMPNYQTLNRIDKFSETISFGFPDSVNFGNNRLAITPKTVVTYEFTATAKDNNIITIKSNVLYDYDKIQEGGMDSAVVATDKNTNIPYPGHIQLVTAERWSNNRLIPNVPFELQNLKGEKINVVNKLPNVNSPFSKTADSEGVIWTDKNAELQIDYLPAGDYQLIPIKDKLPKGYILGCGKVDTSSGDVGNDDENCYDNDKSLNNRSYEENNHKKITFTISDYKKDIRNLNLNLGVFELYYQPQVDTKVSIRNITREQSLGSFGSDVRTIVKPDDVVEYNYQVDYSREKNEGLLHSAKIELKDNTNGNFEIDENSFVIKINSKEDSQVEVDSENKTINLPQVLEPGAKIIVQYSAQVKTVPATIEHQIFEFDHKYVANEFPDARSSAYRNSLRTSVTELHSAGTRYLEGASLSIYSNSIKQNINSDVKSGELYSNNANETNQLISYLKDSNISNLDIKNLSDGQQEDLLKSLEMEKNSIYVEYLDLDKLYYLVQDKAPIGYYLQSDKKFTFRTQSFDPDDYDTGDVIETVAMKPELNRIYQIENEYKTVEFDYTPVIQIETLIKNQSRIGTNFSKTQIAKEGDKVEVQVTVNYPKTILNNSSNSSKIENRGIVYAPKLEDLDHNAEKIEWLPENVDLDFLDNQKIDFGMEKGDKSTADNYGTRMYPGEKHVFNYVENYSNEKLVTRSPKISFLYDKTPDSISRVSQATMYFGRLNLSTFEESFNGGTEALGGVNFSITDNSGRSLDVSNEKYAQKIWTSNNIVEQNVIQTAKQDNNLGKLNLDYLESGTYEVKLAGVPDGNLLNQDYLWKFTIPKVEVGQVNSLGLKQDIAPIKIGVRKLKFTLMEKQTDGSRNRPLQAKKLSGATAKLVNIEGKKEYDTNSILSHQLVAGEKGVYQTNDNGEIIFWKVPEGQYIIREIKAPKGYDFVDSEKTDLVDVKNKIKTGDDETLSTENGNPQSPDPSFSLSQQSQGLNNNDITSNQIAVSKNDLITYKMGMKLSSHVSHGTYRTLTISIDSSRAPSLDNEFKFLDIYIDGQKIDYNLYSMQNEKEISKLIFSEDLINKFKANSLIELRYQKQVDSNFSDEQIVHYFVEANDKKIDVGNLSYILAINSDYQFADGANTDNNQNELGERSSKEDSSKEDKYNQNEDQKRNELFDNSIKQIEEHPVEIGLICSGILILILLAILVILKKRKNKRRLRK
ncbi:MAG: prealbumin-like fold domain-containing protein [Candidatus Ancillula sp.]|nr:prealbumin-like fold domain-containing protein [Candidatus Ancillula sp.]